MAKRTKIIAAKKAASTEPALGERLKFIRESQHLTQLQLATTTGLTQSTIANLEGGKKDPSLQTLLKIAEGLDIHVATLC